MKRVFDFVARSLALMLLALPLGALAWLIRRKLGSPVLFRQVRPGLQWLPLTMVKFRAMKDERGPDGALVPDAQLLKPFGYFLRSSSLDELPELWNVLKGEMSLGGASAFADGVPAIQITGPGPLSRDGPRHHGLDSG